MPRRVAQITVDIYDLEIPTAMELTYPAADYPNGPPAYSKLSKEQADSTNLQRMQMNQTQMDRTKTNVQAIVAAIKTVVTDPQRRRISVNHIWAGKGFES